MATPVLARHTLAGALGEILIDVRGQPGAAARPAVVILHGFKGFKDWGMFPAIADRLASAGFTTVSPNASGSGVDDSGEFVWPERFGHNTFSRELADIEAVLAALDRGALGVSRPSSIGVLGHSRGGGMAILVTGRLPRVGALVTWASISTVRRWTPEEAAAWRKAGVFPVVNKRTGETYPLYPDVLDDVDEHAGDSLDIRRAAAGINAPWLIVHGTADDSVPFAEASQLASAAPKASARLLSIDGGNHGFGAVHPYAGPTAELERVFDETVAWFSRHLP